MERITKRTLALLLTLVMVIGFMPGNLYASANEGVTIYVDGVNGDDANNGASAETAFATIQAAVNAVPGSNTVPYTILVADGVYDVWVDKTDSKCQNTSGAGHGLYINKSNLTITKLNPNGNVTLYTFLASGGTASNVTSSTVRIVGSNNHITLDGLTILPQMRGVTQSNVFKIAIPASELAFLNDADINADADGTIYLPEHYSNFGMIYVNTNFNPVSDLTIQNCTLGLNNETFATNAKVMHTISLDASGTKGMRGNYHIVNNTIYGRVYLNTQLSDASEIVNNDFYFGQIVMKTTDDANLPLIRENTLHSAYKANQTVTTPEGSRSRPVFIDFTGTARYTAGEASVIGKTNNGYGDYSYGAMLSSYLVFHTAELDSVMDSPEELGYYLGQEGTVTLDQSYEITNARMMPNEIKATVDFAGFQITKSADLDIPAPQGWKWENNVLVETPTVSDKTDWITTSLLLNNDLNMRFYVPVEELAEGDYLKVTMEGKDPVDLKVWKDGTGKNADKKYVTFEGIYATQMTAEVTVVLCSANGQAKAGYAVHEDSICKYAERLAASDPEVKWMRLMDAVLNYGAAAQLANAEGEVAEEDLPTYGWTWTEPAA